MSIRFKTDAIDRYGIPPLRGGYETQTNAPDVHIPPCSLEDVDVGVFNLFDKEIRLEVSDGDNSTKKVPVIFASGEKWAILKNGRPLRDRNDTLILPLITIMRSSVTQDGPDQAGRGINSHTGPLVVKRRLDKSDRLYQSIINKLGIPNQTNAAQTVGKTTLDGQLSTQRTIDSNVSPGKNLLTPDLTRNVFETITIPSPQFYTAKYTVTIWTQYTQQSNQVIEKILSSLLPQAQSWRVTSPKGYWFVANFMGDTLSNESNADDMTGAERIIKHTFDVVVHAYLLASDAPGVPIAVKRHVSCPTVSFDLHVGSPMGSQYELGSDDPTLPKDEQKNNRRDQRVGGWRLQKVFPVRQGHPGDAFDGSIENLEDPAFKRLPRGYHVKIVDQNSKGETVYTGVDFSMLEIVSS